MFQLFHCPGTCSLAPLIALEESGATFDKVIVDLKQGEQLKPSYLSVNPKGRVPALATRQGVLTENPAILAFIAQSFPDARLAPLDEPFSFARMQAFNAFIASTLQPAVGPLARPERYADDPAAHESLQRAARSNVAAHLGFLEGQIGHAWVLGDAYSVADAYLFTFSGLIERLALDKAGFPRLMAHRERTAARPAVQRALG